ncbi:tyrosine-type recombinase/integrase [Pelomonas sp. APW6]|uniref:Tyrosine-type recombinase/integrase n=1 Tax=Roseateles subflavus TaxID=3053353 RepID=A0ABT7LNG3_9BURK|nr:tyrosine-type recombinase/integrase [Pelomonas sp. APW6]MDL5034416.1 tyrosine-type recombinase/integrase [Pelomonas sp. APW6]
MSSRRDRDLECAAPLPAVGAADQVISGAKPGNMVDGSWVGQPSTSTRTDADLIEQFLRERCSRSAHTESSYRAQLRRLGWFCRWKGLRTVREMQRELWSDFRDYLKRPPAEHVMVRSVGYGNPAWAPFRTPLSERSAQQAEVIVRGFYAWLADPAIGEIAIDPVRSIRTHVARRSATKAGVHRFLGEEQLAYVERAIAQMPADTDVQLRIKARASWVVELALKTGLRASEIARADSSMIQPSASAGEMVLHISRKGGIESELPLLIETVLAYDAYLAAYGLVFRRSPALPLVLPVRISVEALRSAPKGLTRNHVWKVFKDIMLASADLAAVEGNEHAADRLRQASTHWMRHTFGTSLVDAGADIRSVRDLMDHGSITTTNQYMHRPADKLRADLRLLVHKKT